jgi:hypothetical protein
MVYISIKEKYFLINDLNNSHIFLINKTSNQFYTFSVILNYKLEWLFYVLLTISK